ncbi:hypothetical protein FOC1_g10006844 [Fusarium oxysporum f. sp. cubense race 1]|uniref:Uncharacterized protein n=1 Tax=Fusarium oxysporum f. sp. cubense (strain race 1) TaxID=1229664 RepID=N4TPH1_FUSC1|nr:hypothetical protein FOC1_g10006844 [Fusarium oxysporum f. sp. cubense race 1]
MEKQARQGSFWGWDAVRSKRGITQGEQARAEIQIAEKKGETGTNRESVDTVRREKDQCKIGVAPAAGTNMCFKHEELR